MPLKPQRVYVFEQFRLEPRERVLRCDGNAVPLTPKAFDLLLALVECHGRLVTKDELMKLVWPDVAVEESNLTYNISVLRKALGEEGDSNRFIETVPKRGYRFVPQVRLEQEGALTPAAPGSRRRGVWIASGLGAAVLAGLAWRLAEPGSRDQPDPARLTQWKVSPLTSYPGSERYTSFSPDGNQMAFSWDRESQSNFDIYIQPTGGGTPVQLTTDRAADLSPAWSPDGRWIAFIRLRNPIRLGVMGVGEIFLTAVPGGPEHKLGETQVPPALELFYGSHLSWTPDSQWLVVPDRPSPKEPRGLFLLSIQGGEKRRLTRAQDMIQTDLTPAVSPDGRQLAFIRFLSFSVLEIYLADLSKDLTPVGAPRRVTFDKSLACSPVWTRTGREVLFLSGHLWSDRSLWSIATSGSAKPRRLGSMDGNATALAIGPAAGSGETRLAYTRIDFDPNIWEVELDRKTLGFRPGAVPRRLLASTRVDWMPAFSPDGTRIAFASTRSGSSEIWCANRDGSNLMQLTSFGGPLTGAPAWSPEGQQLVFSSRAEGHADLYVVSASGGAVRRLTADPGNEADVIWARNGQWIYYRSNRGGEGQIWKLPISGGEPVQVTKKGAMAAREAWDPRYLYYSKFSPAGTSLWRVPADGGEETQVLDSLASEYAFAPVERGIYFVAKTESGGTWIQFLEFDTHAIKKIAAIEKPLFSGMTVSPDGSRILYTQVDHEGSDLMQISGLRERSVR